MTYRDVRPGEHVLYDIIQDHYVGVDDSTLAMLEQREGRSPPTLEESELEDALAEQGLLIADRAADDARLRTFLETAAGGIPGAMYVTLMPTLACNLACTYCFQKEHPSFTRMKDPTEAATVEWILRRVDAAASQKLILHYFGGEPLTRKDFLLRTAEIFSSAMAARGGTFVWEITTNGLGLDVEFANAMQVHGPGTIKVTLDGDKATHDAARVYRNGKGSFDEIFRNTVAVAHGCPTLKLRIGGNFMPEQAASYERLLDRLEAAGLAGLIDRLRFKPVMDAGLQAEGTCTTCASGGDAETKTLVALGRAIEQRGLTRPSQGSMLPAGPCELHWKNSYIIDPEGLVYKCPAVAGRREMAVASVKNAGALEKIAPLVELRPWEQCGDCPFLPVCVGGCLGGKYLQTGKTNQVFCKKEQFEKQFQTEIQERYLAEF